MSYEFDKGIAINRCFDEEMIKQLNMSLGKAASMEFLFAWNRLQETRANMPAENGMYQIRVEFYPEEK